MNEADRARQLDAIETDLADVEHALARLEAGSYETCEVCAGVIDVDVLVVTPLARRCRACATPVAADVWPGTSMGTPMSPPPKEASHGWQVR
jgi:RNA polymerase-binding transcription factor DksA